MCEMMELYRQGLDDHKIAAIIGTCPTVVRSFRVCRGLPPNYSRAAPRAYYRVIRNEDGQTITGTAQECAEWMGRTVGSLRVMVSYQRLYAVSDKSKYIVERIDKNLKEGK